MKTQQHQKMNSIGYRLLGCALINAGLFMMPVPGIAAAPSEIRFTVRHFSVEGASPLSQKAIDAYFQPLQQRQYNLKELQEVGKGLEAAIREQGYPFYRVTLPPQTLNAGEVKLQVVSFALGDISVTGNRYFDKHNIIASLPGLKVSESPNTDTLSGNLKVANKHPSKQLQLTFRQSETEDKVDAKINVAEQRPYQASLIFNTVGSQSSGNIRMTGALQHSNLWGMDHILNGSYTTSPDHADSVEQYGTSYSLPVYPLKGWLSGYYAYSNVNNGTVGDFAVTGSGEMYGIHYQQLLPKVGRYEHWLDLGLDNRYFINDIQFRNIPVGTNVRSAPVSVLYKGEYPWKTAHIGYHVQWVGNTDFGDHNSQPDYSASRFGANQGWNLLRYGSTLSVNLHQWLVQTLFTGQHSGDPLIAGEQLGVGGSYDVRGYQERETSADSGEIVKFEITTPAWQKINLFAFYDYGHGYLHNALPGSLNDWNLSSTGVGANWQWQDHIQAKIAVANALNNAVTTQAGDARIHASIVLRY
ncbi:MAG: ShlB/FhaC/HecB family hemolysin secretion/activation protein [Methylovulum sp.]|nr:MAG: ShlB/FhaC/HecB family hemolysin secretion/activation protein [Methylovulum sp.]